MSDNGKSAAFAKHDVHILRMYMYNVPNNTAYLCYIFRLFRRRCAVSVNRSQALASIFKSPHGLENSYSLGVIMQ